MDQINKKRHSTNLEIETRIDELESQIINLKAQLQKLLKDITQQIQLNAMK
jgi:hypothetical protein